jgi:membrane protein DedA with SNARE-associated domain
MRSLGTIQRLPILLGVGHLVVSAAVFGLSFGAPHALGLPILLYVADFPASVLTFYIAGLAADPLRGIPSQLVWAGAVALLGSGWYYALGMLLRRWLRMHEAQGCSGGGS